MLRKTDIPIALTALRAGLAPVVVCLALYFPSHAAFGICMVLALNSLAEPIKIMPLLYSGGTSHAHESHQVRYWSLIC